MTANTTRQKNTSVWRIHGAGNLLGVLLLAGIVTVLASQPAHGQCQVNESAKFLAPDGQTDDGLGVSVAISGGIALVGASKDDDTAPDAGAVYVLINDAGSWVQQAKLLAPDGEPVDHFGQTVALSDNTALIAARLDDDNGHDSGSAYIFRYDPQSQSWNEEAKLLPADGAAQDYFSFCVAVCGDIAVVGAPDDDDNGSASGSVYVFRFNGTDWVEEQKLLAPDGGAGDRFGWSVACTEDTVLIGALYDDDNGLNSGSAYVFGFEGTAWVEQAKLKPADGDSYDEFGISVAISGNTAIIGAEHDEDNGHYSGSAYVFRLDGTTWIGQAKLLPSDGTAEDWFGYDVSICGDIAVVGAYMDDGMRGSAYVFLKPTDGWDSVPSPINEEAKLLASDGEAGDYFGVSVAISNDTAILGAQRDDNGGGVDAGSAYVFGYLSDCDANGALDLCDYTTCDGSPWCNDCQPDGILDGCQLEDNDCNTNGIPDDCEPDCDGDGIIDDCDDDIDGDGVLNEDDVCPRTPFCDVMPDGRPRLDMNNDCNVDGLDIQLVVQQLLEGCSECN